MSPLHIPQRGPYEERWPFPEPSFVYPSWSPVNEPPPPGSPNRAPIERDAPFPDPSSNYFSKFLVNTPPPTRFTHPLIKTKFHLSLKVPGKGAPPPCSPNRVPLERDGLSPEPMVYLFIYISQESPVKEPSHKMWGKHKATIHGALRGWKAYVQWGVA